MSAHEFHENKVKEAKKPLEKHKEELRRIKDGEVIFKLPTKEYIEDWFEKAGPIKNYLTSQLPKN